MTPAGAAAAVSAPRASTAPALPRSSPFAVVSTVLPGRLRLCSPLHALGSGARGRGRGPVLGGPTVPLLQQRLPALTPVPLRRRRSPPLPNPPRYRNGVGEKADEEGAAEGPEGAAEGAVDESDLALRERLGLEQEEVNMTADAMVPVEIELGHHCEFGQRFAIVGDCEALGSWDVGRARPLQWHDGDVWRAVLALPVNQEIRFKPVVLSETDGACVAWADDLAGGAGRNLAVTVKEGEMGAAGAHVELLPGMSGERRPYLIARLPAALRAEAEEAAAFDAQLITAAAATASAAGALPTDTAAHADARARLDAAAAAMASAAEGAELAEETAARMRARGEMPLGGFSATGAPAAAITADTEAEQAAPPLFNLRGVMEGTVTASAEEGPAATPFAAAPAETPFASGGALPETAPFLGVAEEALGAAAEAAAIPDASAAVGSAAEAVTQAMQAAADASQGVVDAASELVTAFGEEPRVVQPSDSATATESLLEVRSGTLEEAVPPSVPIDAAAPTGAASTEPLLMPSPPPLQQPAAVLPAHDKPSATGAPSVPPAAAPGGGFDEATGAVPEGLQSSDLGPLREVQAAAEAAAQGATLAAAAEDAVAAAGAASDIAAAASLGGAAAPPQELIVQTASEAFPVPAPVAPTAAAPEGLPAGGGGAAAAASPALSSTERLIEEVAAAAEQARVAADAAVRTFATAEGVAEVEQMVRSALEEREVASQARALREAAGAAEAAAAQGAAGGQAAAEVLSASGGERRGVMGAEEEGVGGAAAGREEESGGGGGLLGGVTRMFKRGGGGGGGKKEGPSSE